MNKKMKIKKNKHENQAKLTSIWIHENWIFTVPQSAALVTVKVLNNTTTEMIDRVQTMVRHVLNMSTILMPFSDAPDTFWGQFYDNLVLYVLFHLYLFIHIQNDPYC